MQQWRVRIKGQQRQEADTALLTQAVVALGKQLRAEARDFEQEMYEEGDRKEGT